MKASTSSSQNLAQLAPNLETADDLERISFLYETVTSKLPDPSEQEVLSPCRQLHERQSQPALADALCNDLTSSSIKKKHRSLLGRYGSTLTT